MKAERVKGEWYEEQHPVHGGGTALAVALTVSLPQPAHADQGGPSHRQPCPPRSSAGRREQAVPRGSRLRHPELHLPALGRRLQVRPLHAAGHPVPATGAQVTTHFFSPNPTEGGTIRATWQHSRDTSAFWAKATTGNMSADPAFVEPGAIPWVLRGGPATPPGPGRRRADETTFVQRLNTAGGVATGDGLRLVGGRRQSGVRAVHRRLLVLLDPTVNADDDDRN